MQHSKGFVESDLNSSTLETPEWFCSVPRIVQVETNFVSLFSSST